MLDRRRYVRAMQSSDVDEPSHLDKLGEAGARGQVLDTTGEPVGAPPPAARRFDWKLALASLPIAIGLLLIGFGLLRSVSGDEVTKLPSAIEDVAPTPDAVQVLAQTNVVVDLAEGYEGRLVIDGLHFETQRMEDLTANPEAGTQVNIPPGVVFEPGNDTLTFTPGEGIEIERFDEGGHTVQVIYWQAELGEDTARSYTWVFNVV
jgi:hypothetical protein